jgi:photosystem II stability/assembly factor-like uncharacterized protein
MKLKWIAVIVTSCLLWAQAPAPVAPAPKINEATDPMLRGFEFRSIGPAVMMGRVDDIQGSEKDPMLIYVGFATGGLWKSTDGGNHWKSQFDTMANESVGAIGVAPSDPNIVYVGKGEANNRQSSSIGDGVWGTRDGGKTWTNLGLGDTQSINRIAVDPNDPNVVFVAAMGHLFGPNPERGLYKTTDGGKTWKLAKYIDPDTGFNEVQIDPSNSKIVYAASFQRRRTWWGYNGGGPGSLLWKSTDGGTTWSKLDGAGFPKPKDGIYGRMALTIFRSKPSTIYAQIEAGASPGTGGGTTAAGGPQPPGGRGGNGGAGFVESGAEGGAPGGVAAGTPEAAAITGGGGRGRGAAAPPNPDGSGVFRSDDGGATWTFESNQDQRPTYFSQIRVDPKNDQKLFVGGTPAQMSLDGGKTWKGLTGSHTDYHAFWINPNDPRVVWVGHDGGFDSSNDGGYSWDYHNDMAVGQFYQVSADMRHPYTVCGGLQDNNAWCGPSALRSTTGPVNTDWFTVAGGDGFYTRQDPTDWAIVYAESQDGSMSRHDLRAGTQKSVQPRGAQPVPVATPAEGSAPVEPGSPATAPAQVTTITPAVTPAATPVAGEAGAAPAAAGGRRGGRAGAAVAGAAAGGGGGGRGGVPNIINAPEKLDPLRFYWNAPFEISPHDPAVIYMAAQFFFKSTNRGDTWRMNTTDLTKHVPRWSPEMPIMNVAGDKPMAEKHDGYAASSLATQVRESPSKPGVIWVGTDDGNLQVSTDYGENFTNVAPNVKGLPTGYVQISRIEPSHFDPATAYVAFDCHRFDNWAPFLFRTTDYGKTWTNMTADLPKNGPIQALREDLENPDLLFVGTEFGLFVSLDGAKSFKKFMTGLPMVPVDDILIHPRDRDLIIGTHGRSIWICDDISALEHLNQAKGKDLTLFDPRPAIQWKSDPFAQRHNGESPTARGFTGKNPQGGTAITIQSATDLGAAKVEFLTGTTVVSTMDVKLQAGLNRFQWNMRAPAPAANANGRGGRGGGGGGGGGRGAEMVPESPDAPPTPAGGRGAGPVTVPFVAGGRGGGGGGGGGGGFGGGGGALLEPGSYMIRLTAGGKTVTSAVSVLEDIWLRAQ